MLKKRTALLSVLLLATVFLAGCDVLIRWDQPIIIEMQYRTTIDGYVSYRGNQVRITSSINTRSSYRPLADAKITIVDTGHVTWTDQYGYFQIRGVPGPDRYVTMKIEHWRLRDPVYTTIHLK